MVGRIQRIAIWAGFALMFCLSAMASDEAKCVSMKNFQMHGVSLQITRAESMPDAISKPSPLGGYTGTIPAHCRIEGAMEKRTGSDGEPY